MKSLRLFTLVALMGYMFIFSVRVLPDDVQSSIYFSRQQSGGIALVYGVDEQGKSVKQLILNTPSSRGEYNVSVSPDGKIMLFDTYRYGGWKLASISTSNLPDNRNSKVKKLTKPRRSNVYEYNASWSPDSKKIVTQRYLWAESREEMCIISADGVKEQPLAVDLSRVENPSWSPDGKYLLFTGFKDNKTANYEIFVLDITQKGVKPVNLTRHPGHDISPSWSPDGKRIAFHSDRKGDLDLFVMNADGTHQKNVTNNTKASGDKFEYAKNWQKSKSHFYKTSWSPDSQKIAFTSRRNGNYDIYTIRADGSQLRQMTNGPADDFAPFWANH